MKVVVIIEATPEGCYRGRARLGSGPFLDLGELPLRCEDLVIQQGRNPRPNDVLPQGLTWGQVVEAFDHYPHSGGTAWDWRRQGGAGAPGHLEIGAALYRLLFEELATAQAKKLAAADLVEVRLCTQDPWIESLPWTLIARNDRFLLHGAAVFSLCRGTHEPRDSHLFPAYPQVLIVAPEPKTLTSTGAADHVEQLIRVLGQKSDRFHEGDLIRVVKSWEAFCEAVKASPPDFVYYCGHGKIANDGTGELVFEGSIASQERWINVAQLALVLRTARVHRRPLVYVNSCHGVAGGSLGLGSQLASECCFLITNRTAAHVAPAQKQAIEFARKVVGLGEAPERAASWLALETAIDGHLSDPCWFTPVWWVGYGQWDAQMVQGVTAGIARPNWAARLNRTREFRDLVGEVSEALEHWKDGAPFKWRGVVWTGDDGAGLDQFGKRIAHHLAERLNEDVKVLSKTVALGAGSNPSDPNARFVEALGHAFAAHSPSRATSIEQLVVEVLRWLNEGPGKRKTVAYLWHEPIDLPSKELRAFLRAYLVWWETRFLPLLLKSNLKKRNILFLLGFPVEAQGIQISKTLATQLGRKAFPCAYGSVRVLEKFGLLNEEDLLDFIERAEFNVSSANKARVVKELIRRTGGVYEKVVRELVRIMALGEDRWLESESSQGNQ